MDIKNTIATKTGYFIIRTTIANEPVAQESGVADGHLLHYPVPASGLNDFYKFVIYPDKGHKDQYRLVVVGWPEHHIQFDSSAHLAFWADNDHQRYEFKIAPKPANTSDPNDQWYYFHGVGAGGHFDFSSIRYVGPSNEGHDRAKLKFEIIDAQEPDAKKIVKSKPGEIDWPSAPEDYAEIKGEDTEAKLISVEAIPAALIDDDDYRNKIDQITCNPYYYLQWEKYWSSRDLETIQLSQNSSREKVIKYSSSFSSSDYQSIKKTVGHTFDVALEGYIKKTGKISVDDGDGGASEKTEVGASVKLAYQYKNQTETIAGSNQSQSSSIEVTDTIKFSERDAGEDDILIHLWAPVERFTLFNGAGEPVRSWTHTTPGRLVMQYQKR